MTATRICKRDASHKQEETVNTTSEVTTQPTCDANGMTTYTAAFTNSAFATQTKTIENDDALGHDWGEPTYTWNADNSQVTATRTCKRDASHTETETVSTTSAVTTQPTCETKGKTTYTAAFTNSAFTTQTKEVENVDALDHDWGEATYTWAADNSQVTATRICKRDASHKQEETVDTTSAVTTQPTCETKGKTTYTAMFTNSAFTTQTKEAENVDALDHDWGEPTYTWNADNSQVTATRTCKHDVSHKQEETVNTSSAVTAQPTCDTKGKTTYTAAFTNSAFTTQTKVVENIDALGHDWGEPTYTWSSDNRSVTATRTCRRDPSHTQTETVQTTSAVTTQPTCETKGKTTYTAAFTNSAFTTQTKTAEDINATGHTPGTPVKENVVEPTVTAEGSYDEVTYCTVCGKELSRTKVTVEKLIADGWHRIDGVWYYYKDQEPQTGWQKVGGVWYYLDASGAMKTGWLKDNGTWYYLDASGAMHTGWLKVNGTWYYLAPSGAMQTGWQKINNVWYYLAPSGAMQTGWQKINNVWYYLASSGAMVTGWQKIGDVWYYFAPSGAMVTGWLQINGTWYYFTSSGAMVTGTQMIEGRVYNFSSSGAWIPS